MARRRAVAAPFALDARLILPRDLVEPIPYDSQENAERLRRQRSERDEWMAAHGILPADWQTISKVVRASGQAHGIVARSRILVVGDDGTA